MSEKGIWGTVESGPNKFKILDTEFLSRRDYIHFLYNLSILFLRTVHFGSPVKVIQKI